MVDQNYLLVQWEYWGCQNNGQSSQTLTHSLSVCPGKNVNFKLLPCQEQEDNLLTYRISKYRGRKSKGKSPSGALLLISCLLPRKGQRKEPANKISFFFLFRKGPSLQAEEAHHVPAVEHHVWCPRPSRSHHARDGEGPDSRAEVRGHGGSGHPGNTMQEGERQAGDLG